MIRFRPLWGLTIASLIGIAILLGLGKWQLDRLHWKLSLIAAAETRSHAAPVSVQNLIGQPANRIEYARTAAAGEFVPDKEVYLFSQLEDGRVGFEVIAPLRLTDGRILLVDRGFVPPELKGKVSKPNEGPAQVTGLIRGAHEPGLFTPRPDLEKKVWYGRDLGAIGKAEGLSNTLPFLLAEDRGPPGYPEGGHTRLTFRNDHFQYALTWFALAGVLLVIYLAYHVKRGRLRFGPPRSG